MLLLTGNEKGCGYKVAYDQLLEYQLGPDAVACHVRKSGPRNYGVMNTC